MSRYINAALAACTIAVLSACSSQEALLAPAGHTLQSLDKHLPNLPGVAALQQRAAAGLTENLILGQYTLDRSAEAVDNGTALELDATANPGYEWGLYSFDPAGNELDSLRVLLTTAAGNEGYIGLADFEAGRWQWYGPVSDDKIFVMDDPKYLSGSGLLYCAVVAPEDESVTVSALSVRTINPQNINPVAAFTPDVTSGDVPLTVQFDASASSDSDGSIIEYAWDWDSNGLYDAFSDLPTAQHPFLESGIHTVKLRVTDEQFGRDTETVDINVNVPLNGLPSAVLQVFSSPVVKGEVVQLIGGQSSDSDGEVVAYEWDTDGDGIFETATGSTSTVSIEYNYVGPLLLGLKVTDNLGAQATDSQPLVVQGFNDGLTLDSSGDAGQYPSIDVVNGNPAISYLDLAAGNLMFVRAQDTQGSVWSAPQIVDAANSSGYFSSLTVVNGNPAISYSENSLGDLWYVRAADANGSSWGMPVLLDAAGLTGWFSKLEIVNGFPAVAYMEAGASDVLFIRAADADGVAWGMPTTVDSAGQVGAELSLAVVNGQPAISYYEYNLADLLYCRATNVNGTAWGMPQTLDGASSSVGSMTSMQVVNGFPAISYFDSSTSDLKYIRAADASGNSWGSPVVADATGNRGLWTSLAIIGGLPAISYFDNSGGDLLYIRALDVDGGVWGQPVAADTGGYTGLNSSLAEVSGSPAIAYYDNDNKRLRYAWGYF